jgi:hypothetical protein
MCFLSRAWWYKYEKVISGISNIVTTVSVVFAAVALWFSYDQLSATKETLNLSNKQFEVASKSIKASTAFQVSQEGREIARMLKDDLKNVGFAYSFVYSAWYQRRLDVLDEDLWKPIEAEVCDFVKIPEARNFLTVEKKKYYHPEFVEYVEGRIGECLP